MYIYIYMYIYMCIEDIDSRAHFSESLFHGSLCIFIDLM